MHAALRVALAFAAVCTFCVLVIGACSQDPSFVGGGEGGAQGGAGGGVGAQGVGGNAGGPGDECAIAADCPGEDAECVVRGCDNGYCKTVFRAAGDSAGLLQTAGDCRKNACNGEGEATEQNDDDDVPNDGNDCTSDACNAGVPKFDNQPASTPCGVGLMCDSGGLCSGCMNSAQCGADLPCLKQVCLDTKCYQQPVPDGGGDLPGQTAEDCQKIVCNGSGSTKSVNDALDPKPDGNLCTLDGCSAGMPTYTSVLPQEDGNACTLDTCNPTTGNTDHTPTGDGQSCGACKVCSGGSCSSTCGGCESCDNGECKNTCSACETCSGGQCVSNCGGCQQCVGGQCQGGCGPCQDCVNGQCQGGCGPCQDCVSGSCQGGCGPCETCQGSSCVNNCGPCETCNGGQCQTTCNACQTCSGGSCVDNCGPCQVCSGGTCQSTCGPCEACSGGSCVYQCNVCQDCIGDICQFDPCLCDPCCGEPCCALLESQPELWPPGIPPPCW